jgi:hypothetical protein
MLKKSPIFDKISQFENTISLLFNSACLLNNSYVKAYKVTHRFNTV